MSLAHTPQPGQWFFPVSPDIAGNSAALGVGTLRTVPWLYEGEPFALASLAAEITLAGEAGSVLRLGIYGDTGAYAPGALVIDAGTIAGDGTIGSKELAIGSPPTIPPGILWLSAVIQVVTTTAPSVRICGNHVPRFPVPLGAAIPGAATLTRGYAVTGVAGALPATFPAGYARTADIPRLYCKAA